MFFDDFWVPFGRLWGGALGTKVEEQVVEKVVLLRTPPGGAIWEGFWSILDGFWEDFGSIWKGFWVAVGLRFARGLLVFCFWFILGLLVFCCLRVVSLFPSVCSLVSPFLPLCSRVPCVPFLLRASLSHAKGERFGEHFGILAFALLLICSAPLRRFSVRACPYRRTKFGAKWSQVGTNIVTKTVFNLKRRNIAGTQ